jgi:metal-responsive CopG/Arc/MetJ family transcriptional regulator
VAGCIRLKSEQRILDGIIFVHKPALHSIVAEHNWIDDLPKSGAGAIIMLYDNHLYNQDTESTRIQHKYNDIISAATHLHLNDNNCLEIPTSIRIGIW